MRTDVSGRWGLFLRGKLRLPGKGVLRVPQPTPKSPTSTQLPSLIKEKQSPKAQWGPHPAQRGKGMAADGTDRAVRLLGGWTEREAGVRGEPALGSLSSAPCPKVSVIPTQGPPTPPRILWLVSQLSVASTWPPPPLTPQPWLIPE